MDGSDRSLFTVQTPKVSVVQCMAGMLDKNRTPDNVARNQVALGTSMLAIDSTQVPKQEVLMT
jgi:hypothetical protein